MKKTTGDDEHNKSVISYMRESTVELESTQPQEGCELWCPIFASCWQTVLGPVRTGCL